MIELSFIWEAFLTLLPGVPLTLQLAAVSFVLGAALAVPVAMMRMARNRILAATAKLYITVFRGTPLLLQIFLIYYGLAQVDFIRHGPLWVLFRDPYFCAILALTLNMAAYASEAVRGGLLSVPHGQIEAARAGGMSRPLMLRRIILPLAMRQSLPAFGNELIIMIKSTSLASMITVMEITGLASRLMSETYRVVEVLLAAGAIYLTMSFLSARGVRALEHWLNPQLRNVAGGMPELERGAA
ncbi:ABC transporter permease [Paracoccaceae bacterium Fryx2]|nr:ABC transporter permease [Paracoccaceae bacterium Fryx2]